MDFCLLDYFLRALIVLEQKLGIVHAHYYYYQTQNWVHYSADFSIKMHYSPKRDRGFKIFPGVIYPRTPLGDVSSVSLCSSTISLKRQAKFYFSVGKFYISPPPLKLLRGEVLGL